MLNNFTCRFQKQKKNKIQYSGNNLRHSINDYLDIIHKQMLEQIKKQDEENILLDENWSGFNIDNIYDNNDSILK